MAQRLENMRMQAALNEDYYNAPLQQLQSLLANLSRLTYNGTSNFMPGKGESDRMKFISWNVNGLRACLKKGFLDFYQEQKPDFCCLQETKMEQGQADICLLYTSYHFGCGGCHSSAENRGCAGV